MILVGRDCPEAAFVENERLEVLRLRRLLIFPANVDHMESRLIPVHRVENHLRKTKTLITKN